MAAVEAHTWQRQRQSAQIGLARKLEAWLEVGIRFRPTSHNHGPFSLSRLRAELQTRPHLRYSQLLTILGAITPERHQSSEESNVPYIEMRTEIMGDQSQHASVGLLAHASSQSCQTSPKPPSRPMQPLPPPRIVVLLLLSAPTIRAAPAESCELARTRKPNILSCT